MKKNDNNSRRGPATPSGRKPRSAGAGKRDGSPRAKSGFKSRGEGFSSDRRYNEGPGTGRGSRVGTERGSDGYKDSARRTERDAAGYRDSRGPEAGRSGGSGERKSAEWSTGGYRITKKGAGKGKPKKPWEFEQGTGGPRSSESRSEGYRGSRRSTDSRSEGFRGSRRDAEPRSEGYRGSRRDAEPRSEGFRGSKRDAEPRSEGFRGTRRDAEPRSEGFRDSKRGFEKKPRTFVNKKSDNQLPKIDAYKKQEAVIDEHEIEDEDYRIQGRNPVFEALRSGRPLNKLFVEKDKEDTMISRIVAMAREKDLPIQYLERHKLDSISQSRIHQGVIIEVAAMEYVEVDDILKIAADKEEKPFVLVLDGITDTNNLGSIIRSAECSGVHGIIIPKRRSATLNATVAKVAAGAMEYVPVARVSNLVQTMQGLKAEGLWIIGADMEGESNYYDAALEGPVALVIGSEGEGLARLVKEECDMLVKIPMKGKISSLNAGVAAALVMFEIAKQRG